MLTINKKGTVYLGTPFTREEALIIGGGPFNMYVDGGPAEISVYVERLYRSLMFVISELSSARTKASDALAEVEDLKARLAKLEGGMKRAG